MSCLACALLQMPEALVTALGLQGFEMRKEIAVHQTAESAPHASIGEVRWTAESTSVVRKIKTKTIPRPHGRSNK